tara:strand:- start:2559 stop:3143 length:585 start_codon:yes stop_codon:yes gene_type:complete
MIGCGKMAGALLARWATSTEHTISVINPSLVKAPPSVIVTQAIEELSAQRFDIIVVAIKPQITVQVLPAYRHLLSDFSCLISIATGYSVWSIEKLIGEHAIIPVMASLSAQIGRGVSGLYANSRCNFAQIKMATRLTDTIGYTHLADSEDELVRVIAVAGRGSGYAFEFARCWIESTIKMGFQTRPAKTWYLTP